MRITSTTIHEVSAPGYNSLRVLRDTHGHLRLEQGDFFIDIPPAAEDLVIALIRESRRHEARPAEVAEAVRCSGEDC
jgi:hypothetical protein